MVLFPPPRFRNAVECKALSGKKKSVPRTAIAKKKRAPKSDAVTVVVTPSARRRGMVNKAINQALLREKIAARNHDVRANEVLCELRRLGEEVNAMPFMGKDDQARIMTYIGALKTELDGHFKFLNKYLPDQRSVELTDPDGKNPLESAAKAWAEALKDVSS